MYYDKNGKQIDLMAWAELLNDFNYKVIKQETLENGKWISTVWLGLDHSFDNGKLLIFETMVFSARENMKELAMERYSTEEEAIEGHKKMVEKYKNLV